MASEHIVNSFFMGTFYQGMIHDTWPQDIASCDDTGVIWNINYLKHNFFIFIETK